MFPRRQAQITLFPKVCGRRRFKIKGKGEGDVRCQDPWCTSLRSRGIVVFVVREQRGEPRAQRSIARVWWDMPNEDNTARGVTVTVAVTGGDGD